MTTERRSQDELRDDVVDIIDDVHTDAGKLLLYPPTSKEEIIQFQQALLSYAKELQDEIIPHLV